MNKGHDNAVNKDLQDLQQRVEFLEGRENDLAARIARLEEGIKPGVGSPSSFTVARSATPRRTAAGCANGKRHASLAASGSAGPRSWTGRGFGSRSHEMAASADSVGTWSAQGSGSGSGSRSRLTAASAGSVGAGSLRGPAVDVVNQRVVKGWLLEALESRLDEKKPSGSKLDAKASCGSVLYPADEPCADDQSCANQRVWCDGWGFPLPIPWKDRFPLSYLHDDAPAQRPPRPPPPPPPVRWRLRPCCLRALRSRRARWLRDHVGGRGVGIGRGPYVDAWTEEDEAAVAAAAEARARERAAAASRPDIPWYLQNARMRFLRRGLPRRPPR